MKERDRPVSPREKAGGGLRFRAKLSPESLLQLLVLAESLVAMPARGVKAHQPGARLLVGGFVGHAISRSASAAAPRSPLASCIAADSASNSR